MDNTVINEMLQAFDEIQMPRPPYVLEKLVVGARFTTEQQYAQCVLELSIAYDNLRTAKAGTRLAEIEIEELKKKFEETTDEKLQLEMEIKQVELDRLNRARLGSLREFEYLFTLWKSFPIKYTREQLNLAQETEYTAMLLQQAQHDLNATGRIGVGNQEGLRQIGKAVYPMIDVARDVEQRFLEKGNLKILIGVPTEKKAENGLPCVDGIQLPGTIQHRIFNVFERPVDEAYNLIVQTALDDKADYIFTVEDDTFPPEDALIKLIDFVRKNPNSAIGAWYPKREIPRKGVHIILNQVDGIRDFLEDDGNIHEVYTLAMGCSLYPIEMFMKIPYPWFRTTKIISQDSYFSQLAREAGYKLYVDTSIKCKHIDRVTGMVYE